MGHLKRVAAAAGIAGALAVTGLGLATGVANADSPSPGGVATDDWGYGPGYGWGGGPGYGGAGAPGYNGYGPGYNGYGSGYGDGNGYNAGCGWIPPVVSQWIPPVACGG